MQQEPLNVLIVDDQAGVRYLLEIVVQDSGHRAYTASNGLEAVELARSIRPDLVFMDVRMPLMGGLEALEKIKALAPETNVVIMTAFSSEQTVSQAMKKGALTCIGKPFDVDELKEFLQRFDRNCPTFGKTAASG
ncbi:response regulator [Pelotomaculum terephthalicicum JT]|uniref:response regulator n=1 Tax=Pelotomaculum TaxID=191373 RepID=UPI0009D45324|nr:MULTISPECIES: response regulator [Pelotomaculum]MCG9966701.1 response regulator [Pelotomaculum terephthalicicum JT]OPX91440.1 MAG: Sporulation initiation phosphotransferase F [Pelotomaculum sp. PtaB.Bin117]OPY62976.1 MAG: Sporulation initiation phosphotransferase F [Pelotomaculum sp. PtaU1.Bin065]